MAFQTSVLRNGQWVTQMVNDRAAIRRAKTGRKRSPLVQSASESCLSLAHGIVSTTVVDSPVIRRILPVRVRSKAHNDIAFVGERHVQISELRSDGSVDEIARYSDFDSRIRNCAVLGRHIEHGLDDDDDGDGDGDNENSKNSKNSNKDGHRNNHYEDDKASDKTEGKTADKTDDTTDDRTDGLASSCRPRLPRPSFPPQLLVLMLESGDTIFAFLKQEHDGSLIFVWSRYSMPRKMAYLGYHLVIDPSSRYMAAASPDGMVVYELEDMATLEAQYATKLSFSPVKSIRLRSSQAFIHAIEFLYPEPHDDYVVMLLLVCIRKERMGDEPVTRIITYEWERGDSLADVFASEKPGHRLPQEHKLPLLIIPLRFNYSFFIISEISICMVNRCLSGSPVFESLRTEQPGPTDLHQGLNKPLWTAWARPFRHRKYFDKTDIIYLAREDGAIIHIEIEANDLVPSVTSVGYLDANIDTAFATAYDIFSDILIVGGDSGPGGIWKLAPRTDLEQVSVIPNWSPVVDVATIPSEYQTGASPNMTHGQDGVFSASGRGSQGSVTEWRLGIQARIGLEIEFDEPVKQSWLLESSKKQLEGGFQVLMALPSHSTFVNFGKDFSRVDGLTAQDTGLDLAHRTLDACQAPQGRMIQVTEETVSVVDDAVGTSSRYALQDVISSPELLIAESACCTENAVVFSTHGRSESRLHALLVKQTEVHHGSTWKASGHVTCVCQLQLADCSLVIAASVLANSCCLSLYSLGGQTVSTVMMGGEDYGESEAGESEAGESDALESEAEETEAEETEAGETGAEEAGAGLTIEALTGFCRIESTSEQAACGQALDAYFAAGSRCGCLVCIKITKGKGQAAWDMTWTIDKIGAAPVQVSPACHDSSTMMLCCDDRMILATNFCRQQVRFRDKHVVWLTDASDVSRPSPPVNLARFLLSTMSGFDGRLGLLAQSRLSLIVAEMWPRPGLVPRSLPVRGSPMRLVYSPTWRCLVVGLIDDNRPTLAFMDVESGATISRPSDKDRNARTFASGLGHDGDRIYSLYEWTIDKDGTTFSFILVGTRAGRLLVVSVERARDGHGGQGHLQYWTRYKKKMGQPIHSVTAQGTTIVFCAGKTLYWEVLDLEEKKLRPRGQFAADSPATSLALGKSSVMALTTSHSLEIVSLSANGHMVLAHMDKTSRKTLHMTASDEHHGWPIVLLAELHGLVTAICLPRDQSNKQYSILFEIKLPTSIRRFATTHSRPVWQLPRASQPGYGTLPGSHDGADILGFALDGSMQHLTLVSHDLWHLLAEMQGMMASGVSGVSGRRAVAARDQTRHRRQASASSHQGTDGTDSEQVLPHDLPVRCIDGNVLKLWLERRALVDGSSFSQLAQCLDHLDGGCHTQAFARRLTDKDRQGKYVELADKIIDYVLRPVL